MCRKYSIILVSLTGFLVSVIGCATLPTNFEKPLSYAFENTEDTMLAGYR